MVLIDYQNTLFPGSFRITSETRQSMWIQERELILKVTGIINQRRERYRYLGKSAKKLRERTKTNVEILDDDHGKAIFVFTVVTLVFLPLSFVTSFLGMNTVDIRNQDSTQRLFWAIALPLTLIVIVVAVLAAFKYDSISGWFNPSRRQRRRRRRV
jgi:Mg2+ and Co2+ transporter CorA